MGTRAILIVLFATAVVATAGQSNASDSGVDTCQGDSTTQEYFGSDNSLPAQWLARRLCQMGAPSFARRPATAAAAVRCVLGQSFMDELPVITLDARDCVLSRADWDEDHRRFSDEQQAFPDRKCWYHLNQTLDAFSHDQTPRETRDAGAGWTITKVDGDTWMYEWWVNSRHYFGTADVEARPELETPAAVACAALLCARTDSHPLCLRDVGASR